MDDSTFQYLNLENAWPKFARQGLVIDADGALHLAQVPGQPDAVGPTLVDAGALEGPAGIAVDDEGDLYIADPAGHQIIRVDACDGRSAPLPCLRGPGAAPGQLQAPRGLVVGPRRALYVADSGNHRIVVVDLRTQQIRALWGQPEPWATPQPGAEPGRFNEPWDLAVDRAGFLYVVDHGNGRVQKFTADGRVVAAFWDTMRASRPPGEPVAIATVLVTSAGAAETAERLLVIDRADNSVLLYDGEGQYDDAATQRWTAVAAQATMPIDAVSDGAFLYVADGGRVLVFNAAGAFVGVAAGPSPAVAGLALDRLGRLLVHPGGGAAVTQLTPAAAYVTCGVFLAGPFSAGPRRTQWQRLSVTAATLPAGAHVQFFTLTSDQEAAPAAPAACGGVPGSAPATLAATTPQNAWRAAPTDALDFWIGNESGRYLWLAALVQSGGSDTPRLQQMRVDYDRESWARYLPAVYQREAGDQALLLQALALFESLLRDEESLIDALPRLFDPLAAPNENAPDSWLDWLAGWLALPMDETWSEAQRRAAVAEAFTQYGRRGTAESLRRLIRLYTGATAHVTEPAQWATLWSLGEFSTLGFDTMLAPAHAEGAIVGTTATLDQSHLIPEEAYGAPLFDDVAHRFCVRAYAAELSRDNTEANVRRVLEREKPAHTGYDLCLIEARMRVGFQAQLGIDTIVAGPPPDLTLAAGATLGFDTVLPDGGNGRRGALGQNARLGVRTVMS